MISRIFPFLNWFKDYNSLSLKNDLLSGLTVALVLIPQSMAYAQLAGLPPFYGLYASFLPPMIAALFGSSRQLQTGPVAIVSLMTAASLEPLATAGSEGYIAYAIMLAVCIGSFQFLLGILRLGLIINFLSHPVVNGFSNAAAIIIATSQLSKLFGVYVDNAPHHYETIYNVFVSAFNFTHIPTLLIAILSISLMYGFKKINPKLPYVLIAVVITTLISYFAGFQNDKSIDISKISSIEISKTLDDFNRLNDEVIELNQQMALLNVDIEKIEATGGSTEFILRKQNEITLIQLKMTTKKAQIRKIKESIRSKKFYYTKLAGTAEQKFYLAEELPNADIDYGSVWRLKIGNNKLDKSKLLIMGGGAVVGEIPEGLPTLSIPNFTIGAFVKLLPYAIIISLLGFMEAIAIAKAMASKTGQRIDPNQELIGQGLANMVGAIGQSYPVSGSFSRSAVNLQAGAVTGLSSVVTSVVVIFVLLLFTPLLFFLPKAVLATIIMMAVIGLVNVKGFIHAWKAKPFDGIISVITFVVTLAFAPHLEFGIYTGVALSLVVFLYKSMRPKLSVLSRDGDESLKDSLTHDLPECEFIALIRFEGPLFFANASYLEDAINYKILHKKRLKHIIVVSNAINDIDATGEEALSLLINRLRSAGFGVSFSGVNETVMEVFKRTHLFELIDGKNIYPTMEKAIKAVYVETHANEDEKDCPLLQNNNSNQKGVGADAYYNTVRR